MYRALDSDRGICIGLWTDVVMDVDTDVAYIGGWDGGCV